MLLAKSIRHDTRVMKEAAALAAAGFDVRVFYAADEEAGERAPEGVAYVRVDPHRTVRDAWRRHRRRQERALRVWRAVYRAAGRPRLLRRLYYARNALERLVYLRVNEPARFHEFWVTVRDELDRFAPQVVHAHDASALYAGWRHARRRGVPLVYDAHEFERFTRRTASRYNRLVTTLVEWLGLRAASGVITVSPLIAAELARTYRRPRPALVMNSPSRDARDAAAPFSLREACGLDGDARLVVYTGLVIPGRGLEHAVAAFALLPPEYHLAVIGPRERASEQALRERIAAHGLEGRVHLVDPVPGALVVPLIAAGDAAIIPTETASRSADLTLPNKLFEAVMAGLPVAVSGIRGASEFVLAHDLGRVFEIGDHASVASAVRDVVETPPPGVADHERLAALQDDVAWERQEAVLRGVYDALP